MYILLVFIALYLLYWYGTRNHKYWKKRGIKYEKPIPFFGGSLVQYIEKVSFSERFAKLYRQYPNEKFVGFFQGNQPGLVIRDPELIKCVMVTDFKYFHYRGANSHKDFIEPLMMNPVNADGDNWKLLRQKLTPAFSSGRLKAMFPLIVERTDKLLKLVDDHAKIGEEVDIRDIMARFTTDFIGACGFGLNAEALNDEESDFRKLGKRIFSLSKREILAFILKSVNPNLFRGLRLRSPDIETKMSGLVKDIIKQRNNKPSGRNDFIDIMLELKEKGNIVGESIEKFNLDGSPATVELKIDDLLITAQVFIFFAAGFETSSSASSFLLHLLAYHPEEQVLCQKEIDDVLKRHDGKLSYDAVKEMKYLEMAFKESMRVLPSPGVLPRKSVEKYTFPGTDLTIDKNTKIMIPITALHTDEKYFEDPEEFRPERFDPDNIDKIQHYVYMPFGAGPRACIGERLGKMQSLAGVAAVLSKFTVVPSKNSVRKPKINPVSTVVQIIVGGLPVVLKRRQT